MERLGTPTNTPQRGVDKLAENPETPHMTMNVDIASILEPHGLCDCWEPARVVATALVESRPEGYVHEEWCAQSVLAGALAPLLVVQPTALVVDTLGDIRDRLVEMIEAGAHPGSIDWVLHHHVDWPEPEGHVSGNHAAEVPETLLVAIERLHKYHTDYAETVAEQFALSKREYEYLLMLMHQSKADAFRTALSLAKTVQ